MTTGTAALRVARRVLCTPTAGSFSEVELEGLDEPVRRYFRAAIAPGTPLWQCAELTMRGSIRLGRWFPFRAEEVLAPRRGFVWRARVAGLISGFDGFQDGTGEMVWRAAGIVPLVRAAGADVDRSAAARAAGEGIWLPTALLPRHGVDWHAASHDEIVGRCTIGEVPVELHHRLDVRGAVVATWFERWGDPDRTGRSDWHTFGGEVTAHATFDGLTIPSAGRFGWHVGTDRWAEGEFFRCELTALRPS